MHYKEALEIWSMFMRGAQLAKEQNKFEAEIEIDEQTLFKYLKGAFPKKDDKKLAIMAHEILANKTNS